MKAAVIGSPISHSLSPEIFSFFTKKLGIENFTYRAQEIQSQELQSFYENLKKQDDFLGVNVTLPHKEASLEWMDELSEEVSVLRASNVVQNLDGKLKAHNTDVLGVQRTLQAHRKDWTQSQAVVLGAGGAARAVCYTLGQLSFSRVWILNRNTARARELVQTLKTVFPHTQFLTEPPIDQSQISLVIQSTSVGMSSRPWQGVREILSPLEKFHWAGSVLAFDLIYQPEKTVFLHWAKNRGWDTVGGLGMLVDQAMATWEIWNGPKGFGEIKSSLREECLAHLRSILKAKSKTSELVFFTGFMGTGKTAVAQALSKKLGWKFLDTDQWVIQKSGQSIPEIFAQQGELAFRALEAEAVQHAASLTQTVVSLGGGALLNEISLATVQAQGLLICLEASMETLQKRLKEGAAQRPLLKGLSAEEQRNRIESLLKSRAPLYAQAEITIQTDSLTPAKIADQVSAELRRR